MKKKLLGIDIEDLINDSLRGLFEVREDESAANMAEKLRQLDRARHEKDRKDKKKSEKTRETVGDEGDESEGAPAKPVQIKHEKIPEIDAESIADKINSIRSGKSLKEEDTMKALNAYFQKLNGPERIALFAFLAGLEKVLGDVTGDVKTPHSKPFNIDMEQEKPEEKKAKPKGSKEPSATDSSENPIIVGESQNKRNILRVIKSKRRR